jgi:hypothetical protein
VVVGACIAIAAWLTIGGGREQPATVGAEPLRAPARDGTPWWVRVRSATLLGCLAVALGVLAAAAVGAVVLVLFALLQSSVG